MFSVCTGQSTRRHFSFLPVGTWCCCQLINQALHSPARTKDSSENKGHDILKLMHLGRKYRSLHSGKARFETQSWRKKPGKKSGCGSAGRWQAPDQTQVHEATSQLQGNGILDSTSEAGTAPEEEASAVLQRLAGHLCRTQGQLQLFMSESSGINLDSQRRKHAVRGQSCLKHSGEQQRTAL